MTEKYQAPCHEDEIWLVFKKDESSNISEQTYVLANTAYEAVRKSGKLLSEYSALHLLSIWYGNQETAVEREKEMLGQWEESHPEDIKRLKIKLDALLEKWKKSRALTTSKASPNTQEEKQSALNVVLRNITNLSSMELVRVAQTCFALLGMHSWNTGSLLELKSRLETLVLCRTNDYLGHLLEDSGGLQRLLVQRLKQEKSSNLLPGLDIDALDAAHKK